MSILEDRIAEAVVSLRTALPSIYLDVHIDQLVIRCSAPGLTTANARVMIGTGDEWMVRAFNICAGALPSNVGPALAEMLVSARNEAAARAAAIDALFTPHPAPGPTP